MDYELSRLFREEEYAVFYESPQTLGQKRRNFVSPAVRAMEEKKSPIFSLPLHAQRVKRNFS